MTGCSVDPKRFIGFEAAMRRFNRAVEKAGVASALRRHEFHQTRRERRRAKDGRARRRARAEASIS